MTQLAQPRSHLRGLTGMQIRAEVYAAFPTVPEYVLDRLELWQIGRRLGFDKGASMTEAEAQELRELREARNERLKRVVGGG